jgi:hypothetical protein
VNVIDTPLSPEDRRERLAGLTEKKEVPLSTSRAAPPIIHTLNVQPAALAILILWQPNGDTSIESAGDVFKESRHGEIWGLPF